MNKCNFQNHQQRILESRVGAHFKVPCLDLTVKIVSMDIHYQIKSNTVWHDSQLSSFVLLFTSTVFSRPCFEGNCSVADLNR